MLQIIICDKYKNSIKYFVNLHQKYYLNFFTVDKLDTDL